MSIEEMDNQFYQGYPFWRKTKYKEQLELLDLLVPSDEFAKYNSVSQPEKIQFLLNKIVHNNDYSVKDRLALLTKVR